MATILAIDTSSSVAAAGLLVRGNTFAAETNVERHGAQQVLGLVDEVLSQATVSLDQVDLIVALNGPGSFTGLRIGIGAAQGLSAALSIPTLAVSTLAFNAWRAADSAESKNIIAVLQAREDEIYFGAYSVAAAEGYELIGQEQVGQIDELSFSEVNSIDCANWGVIGDGKANIESLGTHIHASIHPLNLPNTELVTDLCRLGELMQSKNNLPDEILLPNYVKEQMDYS